MTLADAIERLRRQNDALEASYPSKPRRSSVPPQNLRKLPELTPERVAEIGRILMSHALLGMFGVQPSELAAFVEAAKRGARK
jgi:hypothetical protein